MQTGRPAKSQRSAFGERLLAARLRLRLSQAQVASQVGVSQQAYAGWERRTMAISPRHIARLAEVLAVGLEYLMGSNPGPVKAEVAEGRTRDLLVGMGKLPQHEQDRLLDVFEDLISAAKKRQKQ